ncbi:MAG: hypothetical protein JWQ32_1818 [Marmoricola sp.]|nr:hypothetical protein [Marmoricola sp.]
MTAPRAEPASGKTLLVHSGTYKTGSTAIQRYLAKAEAAGVLGDATYPVTGRALGVQHLNLNAELRGGRLFTPGLGSWDDVISEFVAGPKTTAIVSTENFSLLSEEQIRVIGDKCRAAAVGIRWVHYMREQASCYNAFYVERLVNLRPEFADVINRPFEEFSDWSPLDLSFLTYSGFARTVLSAVPDVELVLRPFSRDHLIGGDAVSDFCAAAGIPFDPAQSAAANVGTGWRTAETARRLTPVISAAQLRRRVTEFENPAAARMRWVALLRKELILASLSVSWNRESAVYLTPEFETVLRERYRADNERVADYAGFDWAAIADAEPSKAYNVGNYADIPGDQVIAVVERVMTALVDMPDEVAAMPTRAALTSDRRRLPGRRRPWPPGLSAALRRRLRR